MTWNERYQQLKTKYATPENVSHLAYSLWEEDSRQGHGDGEEVVTTALGEMKRRDYHWLHAEAMLEHFADVDAEAKDLVRHHDPKEKQLWGNLWLERQKLAVN